MTYTEKIDQIIEVLTAQKAGKPLEIRNAIGEWVGLDQVGVCNLADEPECYRVKPEPVTRPWSKPEDVPGPVCWIRKKSKPAYQAMIIGTSPHGLDVVACPPTLEPSIYLRIRNWADLRDREYSTDRKSWRPCVVTEEPK